MLLQVFDDGRLTDSHGRTVDFRNTIIVMTSNLGSRAYDEEEVETGKPIPKDDMHVKQKVMDAVRAYFTPELLNRIDEVCVFNRLTRKDMDAIVVKELKATESILKLDRNITLRVEPKLREWLADIGFDPRYGARPLRRAIQHHVLNALSTKLIDGSIKDGDDVIMDLGADDQIDIQVNSHAAITEGN